LLEEIYITEKILLQNEENLKQLLSNSNKNNLSPQEIKDVLNQIQEAEKIRKENNEQFQNVFRLYQSMITAKGFDQKRHLEKLESLRREKMAKKEEITQIAQRLQIRTLTDQRNYLVFQENDNFFSFSNTEMIVQYNDNISNMEIRYLKNQICFLPEAALRKGFQVYFQVKGSEEKSQTFYFQKQENLQNLVQGRFVIQRSFGTLGCKVETLLNRHGVPFSLPNLMCRPKSKTV